MKKIIKFIIELLVSFFYNLKLYRLTNILGIYKPRIVSRIDGGLGSQMWQFALGYSFSKSTGLPFTLENDFFLHCGRDCNGKKNRNFLLFETFPRINAEFEKSRRYLYVFRDRTKRATYDYNSELLQSGRPIYLSQYYANVKYINNYHSDLVTLFDFIPTMNAEEEKYAAEIASTNSCMVHIRKGDFVGLCIDVCTDSYYINAIKAMATFEPDTVFYIFSNDEVYFEQRIYPHCQGYKFRIINNRCEEDPRVDFYLMKLCKNAIISNSGFSWMAAWLKKDTARVIMPDHWNNDPARTKQSETAFSVPGWIKLPTC